MISEQNSEVGLVLMTTLTGFPFKLLGLELTETVGVDMVCCFLFFLGHSNLKKKPTRTTTEEIQYYKS